MNGNWSRAYRTFLSNIELILTAVGLLLIFLIGIIASQMRISFWIATAISATMVGIIHGILFWLLRRRQRRVRQEAIEQIREMLEDLIKNRLQTIKMSLHIVQLQQPDLEKQTQKKFDKAYEMIQEIKVVIDCISDESLVHWRHRYQQTIGRIEEEHALAPSLGTPPSQH
ncbi:hypothetical protein L1047_16020 [Synechococcus sp. Nb3U1]|nr:hypothetical protein [Synechococcus sp. Nb3U1]